MKRLFSLVFLGLCLSAFPQKDEQKNALFTIRGNIGLPRNISSKMYRASFNGIFEANLSLNLRLFSNFYVGIGYQNSYFQNNKDVFVFYRASNGAIPYNTRLMAHGAFMKLGYDKFFSDKGYVSYSLNSGLMLAGYQNVNLDTSLANRPYQPLKFTAPYVQPEVTVNFIVQKGLSFSLMLAYTTVFYRYDHRAPRFAQVEEVNKLGNKYVMSWISFGFGFNVLIHKK